MKLILKPSGNRRWRIQFENNPPEYTEAADMFTALLWYLAGYDLPTYNALQDVPVDMGTGGNAYQIHFWLDNGTQQQQLITIRDVTDFDEGAATEALTEMEAEDKAAAQPPAKKRGRPRNNPDQNLSRDLRKVVKQKRKVQRRARKRGKR